MATHIEDPTVAAYDLLAPFYDLYTHDYQHDALLGNIEAIALDNGLTGHSLLDVGCGTGKSFMPMLARGYEVTGCDISPGMVERARAAGEPEGAEGLVGASGGAGGCSWPTRASCRTWGRSTSRWRSTTRSTTSSATRRWRWCSRAS